MSQRTPFQWSNSNFAWDANPFPNQSKNPFTWDDVALVTEVLQSLGAGKAPATLWNDEKKKKKFIKLLCKVEGKDYTETKEVVERKISISDIALVAKEVLGVSIKIDL